jgi:hypothetical protein
MTTLGNLDLEFGADISFVFGDKSELGCSLED